VAESSAATADTIRAAADDFCILCLRMQDGDGFGYGNNMHPIASNVSIFIPNPVSIYVMPNTFIRFKRQSSTSEEVGIITSIDAEAHQLQIRLFLSWQQMMQRIGPDRIGNVPFWCRQNAKHPPFYLCDSDIVIEIAASDILGLGFVFHESDKILRQLDGMANTYIVTSIYLLQSMKVEHTRSFFSFPCQVNKPLPTCFSSMIFEQIIKIKKKIQLAMNTRSGKSKKRSQHPFGKYPPSYMALHNKRCSQLWC
jgi:hypothetical protein